MNKRINQEINAGSMADIAFLLLIFFLVTTTMSTDIGILRKLPPEIKDGKIPNVKDRNILKVLINKDNKLMVEDSYLSISQIKESAKVFIQNKQNLKDLPEIYSVDFPFLGKYNVTSKHVISLRNDRGTSYSTYIAVQNELALAYHELRDELAFEKWGMTYKNLKPEFRRVVEDVYPMRISEAEPS